MAKRRKTSSPEAVRRERLSAQDEAARDYLFDLLEGRRNAQARERRIPIVLIEDLNQVTAAEGSVEAWLAADESA